MFDDEETRVDIVAQLPMTEMRLACEFEEGAATKDEALAVFDGEVLQ